MSKRLILWKYTLCNLNIHYHPENDGFYLAGTSTGRCYACGKLIYKDLDYKWKEIR